MSIRARRGARGFASAGQPVVPGANLAAGVLQVRAATATDWAAAAPVLAQGELAFVTDAQGRVVDQKVGDGSTSWSSLPSWAPGNGTYAPALPSAGSFTYDGGGNPLTDPDGNTYTWNTDGTPHTQTKGGVTRTFTWNADGTLASVA